MTTGFNSSEGEFTLTLFRLTKPSDKERSDNPSVGLFVRLQGFFAKCKNHKSLEKTARKDQTIASFHRRNGSFGLTFSLPTAFYEVWDF